MCDRVEVFSKGVNGDELPASGDGKLNVCHCNICAVDFLVTLLDSQDCSHICSYISIDLMLNKKSFKIPLGQKMVTGIEKKKSN